MPVEASSRAMRLRSARQLIVKPPPAKILPSGCIRDCKDRKPFAFGSKESAKPVVASSRAMRLRSVRQCCSAR